MKKYVLLLTLFTLAGCGKNDPAAEEVEVQTQGRDLACGRAQVLVHDPAQVARLLGTTSSSGTYLALQLDTALWLRRNQALLLRIRRPTTEEEGFVCNTLGAAYPRLVVVSARAK